MTANPMYHDLILDQYSRPRNKGELALPDAVGRGARPMCGDDLVVQLRLDGDARAVEEIVWSGHACAVGEASASMMTVAVKGGGREDARRLVQTVRSLLSGRPGAASPEGELGDLAALEGVKRFPMRVQCALLAWDALESALTTAERRRNAGNTTAVETAGR